MASSMNANHGANKNLLYQRPVKTLLFNPQNMIIFIPTTITSGTTEGTTAATCLLLVGPISVRTETRELDLSKLGEALYLETIDQATMQLTVGGIPRALEGMNREWFANCKTVAERFQQYVLDFQAAYWAARRGRLGLRFDFEGSG